MHIGVCKYCSMYIQTCIRQLSGTIQSGPLGQVVVL